MGLRDLMIGVGFLLLFEGLPLLAAPGFYRRVAQAMEEMPESFLRGTGLAAATTGMIILYAIFLGAVH